MPSWITPDLLTGIGFLGAVMMFTSFWLAERNAAFLWPGILGLALNWLGDSLDGSVARYRDIERPQYGFFLDHSVDSFAMGLVATGIGLSPMAHVWCALLALGGYYIVAIMSLLTCLSTGVFKISFSGIGPTEIRLGIIICSICAALLHIPHIRMWGLDLTIYDGIILALTVGLVLTAVLQAFATARQLATIDPPRR